MDSFREVYERHYRAVYQMALFLTGVPDQAEDLAIAAAFADAERWYRALTGESD